jgi:hypothetical protein
MGESAKIVSWSPPTDAEESPRANNDNPDGQSDQAKTRPSPPRLIQSSADFIRGFVPPDYLIDGVLQRRFCY